MIILRQHNYSYTKLYKEWEKTKDPETAWKWSQEYNKAYEKHGNSLPQPDPEILKSVDEYIKMKSPGEHKMMTEWNNAVKSYHSGKDYKLNPKTAKYIREKTGGSDITEKIINKSK